MKFYVKAKLSENISETPEGYLLCRNVPLTHTGELHYARGEHPFPEIDELIVTRDKDEIFSEKTMSSFMGKSVTIEHPKDFVTPETWQELTNGTVVNVRPSPEKIDVNGKPEDALLGDLLITTKEAIKDVKGGLREVSLGYDALWEHVKNNLAVHRNIIGNHVALVNNGRAGENFAIKDSKENLMTTKMKDLFKKLTGKSFDEAMKEEEKKDESKDSPDVAEMKKQVADLQEKIKAAEEKPKESKDDDMGGDKMDKIIAMLEKMMGMEKEEAGDDDEVQEIVATDEDESKDDDNMYKAGDSEMVAGLAEILAPGIEMTKDVKTKSLETAYKTNDGKKIIDALTGNKKLSEIKDHDILFNAAAQALRAARTKKLTDVSAKATAIDAFPSIKPGAMTPEKINEINEQRFKTK